MRKFVIMGVQGSGKGTQAKLLADEFDLEHISVGDILRWNVQHHTKLGAQVRRIVSSGHLVDDELVESVVRERLSLHDWNYGFIVDGFPRNVRQAEFFLESYDIDGVINLELADSEVERRVLARRLCSGCGLDYNLMAHRPEVEDVCDVCGSALLVRSDDNPEALAVRLREYHEKTTPVIELFQRKEFVASFDATRQGGRDPGRDPRPVHAVVSSRPPWSQRRNPTVTPPLHDGGMTSTTTNTTRTEPSEQLTLLPDTDVPLRFRLDDATRRRGLRHIAEIRALLDRPDPARPASGTRRSAA